MVKQTPIITTMQTIMHKQNNTGPCLKTHLWCITLFLFLLLQSSIIFAGITASTGRTVLGIDESIELVITSDSSSGSPDLSVLEENFQILSTSQNNSFSYINGNISQNYTWNITLQPRQMGELTIPAIKAGNESTQPIHLVIQKQTETKGSADKEIYLSIEVTANNNEAVTPDKAVYVQQQLMVTVQLFHRIRFLNASLSNLEIENTVIEKIGNDVKYSKMIDNNRYNVIELRYAVYPQQSGILTIPSLTFSGNAEISQDFFQFSRSGKKIVSRTEPLSLNILPIPENYTGKTWLPAESLDIETEILEDTKAIMTGEAITRNIVIRAKGLLGSQLPATTMPSSKAIKTYPDKEKLSNQLVNGKIIGVRRDTIAIIPLKPGSFTLPEININWWNTTTNQQETSVIASRTLTALPGSEQTAPVANKQKTTPLTAQIKNTTDAATTETIKVIEKIIYENPELTKNIWFWVSLCLLILWLMTLVLLIMALTKKNKNEQHQPNVDKLHSDNIESEIYLQQIYQACLKNDAHNAGKSLIQWAKLFFKQPVLTGLSALIELIDNKPLGDAINYLESCQYSRDKESWQGDDLSSALNNYLQKNTADKKAGKNKTPQALSFLNP